MYHPILTDKAISDINKAKKWYNEQQENLGEKFTDYVFKFIDDIKNYPTALPRKHKNTREIFIKKYPYLIIYSIEEKVIFILRVFPCKTSPKKKYKKLKK